MPQYNQMPIRLQADLIVNPPVVPTDANTGLPIQMWARTGAAVAVGIFDALGVGVDLSNLAFLTLTISETATSLVPIISKQILAGALIPYVDRAAWLAQQNQNATFVLSNAEMDLSLDGGTEATYFISLMGQTTGGANVVYAAGPIRVYNPGPGIPQPSRGFVSYHNTPSAGANLQIQPLSNVHTETIPVTGVAGTRDVAVLAVGLEAGARIVLRLTLPATNGLIHRFFDQSLAGPLLATITCDPDGFTPAATLNLFFDGASVKRDSLIMPAFGQQN